MRLLGFDDAAVTRAGADGGIDVRAKEAVAQVKFRTTATGSPDVQRLAGATARSLILLFYSGAGYSAAATKAAVGHQMALFRYTTGGGVYAENAAARRLYEAAGFDPKSPMFVSGFTLSEQTALIDRAALIYAESNAFSRTRQEVYDEIESQIHGVNVRHIGAERRNKLRASEPIASDISRVQPGRQAAFRRLMGALSVIRDIPENIGWFNPYELVWQIKDAEADKVEQGLAREEREIDAIFDRVGNMPSEWAKWFRDQLDYEIQRRSGSDYESYKRTATHELRFDSERLAAERRRKEAQEKARADRWKRR